jgi:hypothetical protein
MIGFVLEPSIFAESNIQSVLIHFLFEDILNPNSEAEANNMTSKVDDETTYQQFLWSASLVSAFCLCGDCAFAMNTS